MDYYCETTPLFEIKGVTKYRNTSTGRAVVLNSVFARVDNGNLVTIIGPSGAGKSTLLLLLNRLEDVDEGNIFYQGRDIREWNVLELRQQVGLVFQQPVMLPGNVQDNLLFGPALRGENPIFKPEKIMDMVGLKRDLLQQDAGNLSGGEQQRVALARTIINGSRVLLLDEITASLDPDSAKIIEDLIIHLNCEHGYTCLWVTHDREQAARVGRHRWLVKGGKVVDLSPAHLKASFSG